MTSSLTATPRDTKTKGEINNLRTKGLIPAIVYGGNQENKKIYKGEPIADIFVKTPAEVIEVPPPPSAFKV